MYRASLTLNYSYGSTEKIIEKKEKEEFVLATTFRTYNNFHQLIEEETWRHAHIVKTEIEYYSSLGEFIKNQPKNFSLPHKTTVTYIKKEKKKDSDTEEEIRRTEQTITEYDDHGDLKSIIHPNGNKEVFSWEVPIPKFSSTDKEKNIGNIVRHLVKKVGFVVDRSDSENKLIKDTQQDFSHEEIAIKPIKIYKDYLLPIFVCKKVSNSKYEIINNKENIKLLNEIELKYELKQDNEYFGKIRQIKEILKDTTDGSAKRFETITDIKYKLQDLRLITTVEQTATNQTTPTLASLPPTLEKEISVFTGVLLKETDASKITTEYKYDELGRLKEQIYASGTEYRSTNKWDYKTGIDRLEIREIDGLGNMTRTSLNGDGQVMESHFYDLDISKEWCKVYDCSYDVLGRKVIETAYDYTQKDLRDKNQKGSIKKAAKYEYDDRNNKVIWINADRTKGIMEIDPIGLTSTVYKESFECGKSGVVITKFDSKTLRQTEIIMKEDYDKDDVFNRISYSYDNLGRVVGVTDIVNKTTTAFEYDIYNRVTKEILPDDSVRERKYAGHLTTNQVTSIGVRKTRAGAFEELGTRKYDNLGRLIENSVGGRMTKYKYNANNYSFSPDKVVLPGENSLEYSYIKELGYKVSGVIGKYREGNQLLIKSFVYDEKSYSMLSHTEGVYAVKYNYFPSGRLKEESFNYKGEIKKASTRRTLLGLIESYTDITGKEIRYERDLFGKVTKVVNGDITRDVVTDNPCHNSNTVFSKDQSAVMGTSRAYNKFSQEVGRMISISPKKGLAINKNFNKKGMLQNKDTKLGSFSKLGEKKLEHQKEEIYQYDKLNRLTVYKINLINTTPTPDQIKEIYPKGPYGNLYIQGETYVYDHFDNIIEVETIHTDATSNTANYNYKNQNDPTQLSSISNNHPLYPSLIEFKYDKEGRMSRMSEHKREREEIRVLDYILEYDIMGRLIKYVTDKTKYTEKGNIKSKEYQYNGLDEIVEYDKSTSLYYNGNSLVNKVTKEASIRYVNDVAIEKKGVQTFIGKNQNGSVIATQTNKEALNFYNYTPYGYTDPEGLELGYNGELIDGDTGVYHLGKGYRAYNPILRRFNCPDSMSPFDGGGINPYTYCNNNPVMYTDPSGHLSGWAWTSIGLGVLGLGLAALTIATGGASLGLAGAILLTLDVNSSILGIASGALEKSNPKASTYLGYGALATGAPGLARALYKSPKAVKAGISWVKGKYYGYGSNAPLTLYHGNAMHDLGGDPWLSHVVRGPGNTKLIVVGHGGEEIELGGSTHMISAGEGKTVHFHAPRGHILNVYPAEIVSGLQAPPIESVLPGNSFENRYIEMPFNDRLATGVMNRINQPNSFHHAENYDLLVLRYGRTRLDHLFTTIIPNVEQARVGSGNLIYSDIHMAMCRPAGVRPFPIDTPRHFFGNRREYTFNPPYIS
nr:RHS repeat-associated core domain-containing protein [Elizabethkingia sp. ASV34]